MCDDLAQERDQLVALRRGQRLEQPVCLAGPGLGQRTLDETGLETSTAFMVSPQSVAKAVVRALEKEKAELVVMKGPGRLLKTLMNLFPGFGPAMNRLAGADKVMNAVADFRDAQVAASP